jgi:hypothetical protein
MIAIASGDLISYAPARLNLFNKIHAEKPYLPANLDSSDSQPSLRDSIRRASFSPRLFPGWEYVWRGGPPGLGADAFSQAGTNEALALPALKRVIRVETLSRSAKALLPPAASQHQELSSIAISREQRGSSSCR